MVMVMPRAASSGALSMPSNATYRLAAGSRSARTFVMAAVRVVFPWSTWPIVPMLTCGLLRMNWLLAMVDQSLLDARHSGDDVRRRLPGRRRTRTAQGADTLPRVLLLGGKGQTRESAHTGAAAKGSFRPGANMRVTIAVNACSLDLISRASHQRN